MNLLFIHFILFGKKKIKEKMNKKKNQEKY